MVPIVAPADSRRPPRAYPTMGQAVGLLLLLGGLLILAGVFVVFTTPRQSAARFLANGAALILGTGVVVAYGVRRSGAAVREVLPLRRVAPRLVPALIVLFLGGMFLTVGLTIVLERIWPKPASLREMERRFLSGDGSLVGAVLVIAVLGPLAEEALFRGLILHGFLRNYGVRKAIVAAAVLFALYHVNPWQMPLALVLGIVFGAWRVGTGSLWPSVVGHAIVNAVPVLAQSAGARSRSAAPPAMPAASTVVGILVVGALLLALGSRFWRRVQRQAA